MAYHKNKISKGELGEYSKIKEEFQELTDAVEQDSHVLILCELSDLIGAIELYASKWNITLDQLIDMKNKTKSAFEDGKRN